MRAFGYPRTLIREYVHWAVLLRPAQPTLGSLVLAARSPAQAFSDLPPEAFAELATVTGDIETALKARIGYEKINYLMLMMVDKDVHFHVIPRYDGERQFGGAAFFDAGWPKTPDLASAVKLDEAMGEALRADLAAAWPGAGAKGW